MYQKIKPLLFKLQPETAHNVVEKSLRFAQKIPLVMECVAEKLFINNDELKQNICGLDFYNPVGLAAGFDKNATIIRAMSALGFGHLEIGTLTLKAQEGNLKPRLFRFSEEESLQNAMGFNNDGAQKIMKRISKIYPYAIPIGINIGKSKSTESKNALEDYLQLIELFSSLGDYFTINISSPNTPNLRDLQNEDFIKELLKNVKTQKPIFLKISPDMKIDSTLEVCNAAIENGISGIIATNTTTEYALLKDAKNEGGISGKSLKNLSREIFEILCKNFCKKTILISVGGISDGKEAYERIRMGASLVQIYTGIVFEGPRICKNINDEILLRLKSDGFKNISEAIGTI